jgi:hypothetical protein
VDDILAPARDGTFLVWARDLDRVLELQFKTGDSRAFNLRNCAVNRNHTIATACLILA